MLAPLVLLSHRLCSKQTALRKAQDIGNRRSCSVLPFQVRKWLHAYFNAGTGVVVCRSNARSLFPLHSDRLP